MRWRWVWRLLLFVLGSFLASVLGRLVPHDSWPAHLGFICGGLTTLVAGVLTFDCGPAPEAWLEANRRTFARAYDCGFEMACTCARSTVEDVLDDAERLDWSAEQVARLLRKSMEAIQPPAIGGDNSTTQ